MDRDVVAVLLVIIFACLIGAVTYTTVSRNETDCKIECLKKTTDVRACTEVCK